MCALEFSHCALVLGFSLAGGCRPKRPNAEARVMFDMSADVRGLFTWNTKLVFLYVTAEYKTELNVLNQIFII